MSTRRPSPQDDQPNGANQGIPTRKKIERTTSTDGLLWSRRAIEPRLFSRWARVRGMFRDNHLEAGCAAHHLFTEDFGGPTLKPYRPFISGIFQAYPTIPSEELKTHAAICADPPQQRMLPLDTLEGNLLTQNCPDNVTVGFESMIRPIIGSQDNEHDELDHFTLRHDGDHRAHSRNVDLEQRRQPNQYRGC